MPEPAKEAKTPEQKRLHRSRWMGIASGIIVVGFIISVAYFGLKYFRDTSYQDERAFRVLGHVVGQFGNLQEAIAGALQLAPEYQKCKPSQTEDGARARYARSLTLRGVQLTRTASPTPSDQPNAFRIGTSSRARTFSVSSCGLTMSGPLADQVPIFINQSLFETVAIAAKSGKVLAAIPRARAQTQHVQLHGVAGIDLFGGDVAGILRNAALREAIAQQKQPGKDDKPVTTERTEPGTGIVYAENVGGQPFRIFVLPFEPARPTIVEGEQPASQLYLIGVQRQNVLESVSDALGAGGALVVTLGVLICVLLWPFISLRFSSPQEAIAPTQVLAVLLALLLIPAVVATAGFSLWTRYRLMLWADQQAEIYALRVEQTLIREMEWGLHMLEPLAEQYASSTAVIDADFMMKDCKAEECFQAQLPKRCTDPRFPRIPENWSPIRSAAPLNREGRSSGLTLNFFQPSAVDELNLADREYYRAIVDGDEWLTGNLWSHEADCSQASEHRYVAQRLFNRSDAARALQLAVPIDIANGERIGLVTGDTRAYGLSATLRPPLLRFAIFDHHSGAVLFHTNDERSLAENFIVETEENGSLIASMQKRASRWSMKRILLDDHFTGRYIGESHRFYHRAVPGAPWGLVVFYETNALDSIVLHTAVATLGTYFLIGAIGALVLGLLVLVLPTRAGLAILRWIWPRWNLRERYRIVGNVTIAILAVLATIAVSRLNDVRWSSIAIALVLTLILLNFAARPIGTLIAKLLPARGPSVTAYARSYARCMFGVLCLISAVPVIYIAVGYHDTSVHAFVRDELLQAARDEEQRRRTLLRDDRHFNSSASFNLQRAIELSQALPVPGYEHEMSEYLKRPLWSLTDADPNLWLSACGPPVLNRLRRAIWALSSARQIQHMFASSVRRPEDPGEPDELNGCRPLAVQAWQRSEDGTLVSIALPLKAIADDLGAIGECRPGRSGDGLCRDPELHTLYTTSSGFVLTSVAAGCALLILLLSSHVSRRLFGIRIPFSGRFIPSQADEANASALLEAELALVRLKNTPGLEMTSKDEADWRAQNCRPIYERMWKSLDNEKEQQLLLLHLAHGRYANPENRAVIEQLLRRGYIALAPWPRIVEPGFAEFIRSVHPSDDVDALRYEASHTPWSTWRTPILIVVIIVAALLMWLAGGAMHIVVGVLGGVATLFGSLTQVTSFIHRDKPAADK